MVFAWLLLATAIVIEVLATAVLPRTQGFTDPAWTTLVVLGYGASIWLLAVVVDRIPVSVAYAVWSGAGTALVAVIGLIFLGEPMGLAKAFFIALIISGVIGLNLVGAA